MSRETAHTDAPAAQPSPARAVAGRLFRIVRNSLALVGLFMIIYHLGLELSVMTTDSMAPTLRGGQNPDWLLSEKLLLRFRHARRWEIVQFRNEEGLLVAKRVVGLPGETVELREHQLLINGQPIAPPAALSFLKYYAYGNLRAGNIVNTGDGYFVLGDDSVDSFDSRYVGPVPPGKILSRAWLRVRPASRFGFANP